MNNNLDDDIQAKKTKQLVVAIYK